MDKPVKAVVWAAKIGKVPDREKDAKALLAELKGKRLKGRRFYKALGEALWRKFTSVHPEVSDPLQVFVEDPQDWGADMDEPCLAFWTLEVKTRFYAVVMRILRDLARAQGICVWVEATNELLTPAASNEKAPSDGSGQASGLRTGASPSELPANAEIDKANQVGERIYPSRLFLEENRVTFAQRAVFSHDSEKVAFAFGRVVQIRDVRTGRLMRSIEPIPSYVCSIAFSPDGSRLMTGCEDQAIREWSVDTGKIVTSARSADIGHVLHVAYIPAGDRVVTGPTVRVWRLAEGARPEVILSLEESASGMSLSGDGAYLFTGTGGFGGPCKLWDLHSGQLRKKFDLCVARAKSVCQTASASHFAVASGDSIDLCTFDGDGPIGKLSGHGGSVESICFSPDGRVLASGSLDGTIRIWDVAEGKQIECIEGLGGDQVECVAFSPDGRWLLSAGRSSVIVRRTDGFTTAWQCDAVPTDQPLVAVSGDGRRVAVSPRGYNVQVWDTDTCDLAASFSLEVTDLADMALASQGDTIAIGSQSRALDVLSTQTGKLLERLGGRGLKIVKQLGDRATESLVEFVKGSEAQDPILRSVPVRAPLVRGLASMLAKGAGRALDLHTTEISCVSMSPDNTVVASGDLDGTIRLWDSSRGVLKRKLEAKNWVTRLLFAQDGKLLVASAGRHLYVWSTVDGKLMHSTSFNSRVLELAEVPGSEVLQLLVGLEARMGDQHSVHVREYSSFEGRERLKLGDSHRGLMCLSCDSTGRRALTSSRQGRVQQWDLLSGKESWTLEIPETMVVHASFKAGSDRVITAGSDHMLRLWDVANRRCTMMWTTQSGFGGGLLGWRGVWTISQRSASQGPFELRDLIPGSLSLSLHGMTGGDLGEQLATQQPLAFAFQTPTCGDQFGSKVWPTSEVLRRFGNSRTRALVESLPESWRHP